MTGVGECVFSRFSAGTHIHRLFFPFLSFLCVAWGVEWTGRIANFSMGLPMELPIVLLFVFLGKALTLEGDENGIEAYIGSWDVSVLTEQGEV